jgi:1,4-dihydroxy-2-naphthoate octaprenyltransferase
MSRFSVWWQAARPWSFTVSVIPPILGGIIAALENPGLQFKWFHFVLTLIGCVSSHAGANMLSDYYDFKVRVDREGTYGGSGVLVGNVLTPAKVFWGSMTAYFIAGAIGVYLILATPKGLFLLWLILIGGILGVFYTARPFAFKYHALGDLGVFVSFGSAMTLGAYFVQAHHFSWAPVLYALPVALLVDAILHSNNLRDIENDSAVGIKTVAIAIGEQGAKRMYYALVLGAYVVTIALVGLAGMPLLSLITLLSFPLALKLVKIVSQKDKVPEKQFIMIDAATAQLHSAFGLLLIVSLLIHYLAFA